VRRRLVLAIVAVAAAAVVLFAVPLGIVLGRSYRDEELLRLQRDTIAATRSIDVSGGTDRVELPPSPDALTVYDRSGRRQVGSGPRLAPGLVSRVLSTGRPADSEAEGRLVAAVPLLVGERVAGALRAVRPDARAATDARRAWLALGGLAGAIVLVAVGAAVLVARRLAHPLERLAGAARRLGEGDFTATAPRASIPEVDAVGTALAATAARLGDLVARERAFSADASHQLRTPLAALRIELEALALRAEPTPELTAALAQIDRLEQTVETLLRVARDESGTSGVCTLERMLDEVEADWRGPLAASGRALRIRAGEAGLRARATPAVIRQVLDVLVENAARHGAGTVALEARGAGAWVTVEVADEGSGFGGDPERAFVRRAPEADGHGIGLALARALAHAEGGRLTIAEPGPRPRLRLVLRAAED